VVELTEAAGATRKRRLNAGVLCAVEIIVLAPLAAFLAFWAIPEAFGIEWSCIGAFGVSGSDGESFAQTVAVVGTIGWFVILLATLFASIAERERLAAILPFAWFVVLVAGMTIAAAATGPAPCPV
jgi:hypothetical protein